MGLTRRELLKLVGGSSAGAAVIAACRPAVREFIAQSPVRMPEDLVTGIDNWYATTCQQCGSGCGTIVRVVEGRAKKVEGNPLHPINAGKLCVRGQPSVQAVYHPDRIRRPIVPSEGRGSNVYREVSWTTALDDVVKKLEPLRGSGGVVVITEPVSGSMAQVARAFAGAMGGQHIAFEALETNVLKQAIKNAFGQDQLPFFDIGNTSYLLSFGADFLNGWVSQVQHSRGYGEFRQGERPRGTFVQVDSRFSMSAANAEGWMWVRPGGEGKLALAIAYVIVRDRLAAPGSAEALFGGNPMAALDQFRPEAVAGETGVSADRIEDLAHDFADPAHQPALAIGGGSAGAHTNGVASLTAIYALNHLVGSAGKRGGVIFNPAPPLGSDGPFVPARSAALEEMRELTARMQRGEVRALLVRNADPAFGLPEAVGFREALQNVPFIASFSSFLDDTSFQADIVLPGNLPLEDWGDSMPNPGPGYEMVSYQQPVVLPFRETQGFADVLLTLAQDLGLEEQLPWNRFQDVLRENAERLRNLGRGDISGASFEAWWNDLLRQGAWTDPGAKGSSAVSIPSISVPDVGGADIAGVEDPDQYKYFLVPYESISLGDGRNSHLPWMQATPDPITTTTWATWVEVNLRLAEDLGLREGDVVNLTAPSGRSIRAAVYPNPATPPEVLGVPMGQGYRAFGRYAERELVNPRSNPLSLLADKTDKETGSLAWAATRVSMDKAGERVRIPKMENAVVPVRDYNRLDPEFGVEAFEVVKVTSEDS